MAVRNFWIDVNIDGRQTFLSGGPKAKTGGMDITIYQRNEGSIKKAISIYCRADGDRLYTEVYADDKFVAEVDTDR